VRREKGKGKREKEKQGVEGQIKGQNVKCKTTYQNAKRIVRI